MSECRLTQLNNYYLMVNHQFRVFKTTVYKCTPILNGPQNFPLSENTYIKTC